MRTNHGKPLAQLGAAPPEEPLDEDDPYPDHWINKIAGLCKDAPEFCDLLDEIVRDRRNWPPREPIRFEDNSHGASGPSGRCRRPHQ